MAPALAAFLALLALFHASEFALAAAFDRRGLSRASWLLSWPYAAAMALALGEYLLEAAYAPSLKARPRLAAAGLAAALAGEALRKAAVLTARGAFTHRIQAARRPGHDLVTRGVYRWMRHPGYAGWALWAASTQVLLCNPLSLAVFLAATWRFMAARIEVEDALLARMFGAEWAAYRARTPSGLPFIR
jgi:protein-S-isoprenylcysteine O-methyltransferase